MFFISTTSCMQSTKTRHPDRQPTHFWASQSPFAKPGPKEWFSCLPMACHFCLTSYFSVLLLPRYKQPWISTHSCCTVCVHRRQVPVPWRLISSQRHRHTLGSAVEGAERGINNAGMHFVSCQSVPAKGSAILFVFSAFRRKPSV